MSQCRELNSGPLPYQGSALPLEKKEFKGTGGGTYTTIDGKYSKWEHTKKHE